MTDEEILHLISESIKALKYIPLECNIHRAKNKHTLRIVLHHLEKEIGSEDCAEVAEIISRRLDIDDPFDKKYDLIVESPGLEREIKSFEEYSYFLNREFRIVPSKDYTLCPKEGYFIGILKNIENNNLTFIVNDQESVLISPEQIQKSRLYCDFSKILKESKKD